MGCIVFYSYYYIKELGTLTERLHLMIEFQSNELLRSQIPIMNLTMFLCHRIFGHENPMNYTVDSFA